MFKNPFSFDGRIRRTEFGLSLIFYSIIAVFINLIIASDNGESGLVVLGLAYIPMVWFLWAQGAKRCHDLDNSGWWQIIPFYVFWLLFEDGASGVNQYGDNPKGKQQNFNQTYPPGSGQHQPTSTVGYPSTYDGGHNNPNSNNQPNNNQNNSSGEYNSGELYKQ